MDRRDPDRLEVGLVVEPAGNDHFDISTEFDGTDQLIARYLNGDEFDQTLARVTDEPTTPVVGSTPQVHRLLTFGNIIARLNPTTSVVGSLPLLLTSRLFDAETGLYYYRARYLDPSTGRWTTQDSLRFVAGDANLSRNVGNTPTTFLPRWLPGQLHHWAYCDRWHG